MRLMDFVWWANGELVPVKAHLCVLDQLPHGRDLAGLLQ